MWIITSIFTYVYLVLLKVVNAVFPINKITIISGTNYDVSLFELTCINIGINRLSGYINGYENHKILIYFYYKNRYCITCCNIKDIMDVHQIINNIKNNYKNYSTIKIDNSPYLLINNITNNNDSVIDIFKNIIKYDCEVKVYDLINDKKKIRQITINYYHKLSSKIKIIEGDELNIFLNLNIDQIYLFILQ